jgi:hypothetical protein
LTTKEFSERIGVHQNHYNSVENLKVPASKNVQKKISEYLISKGFPYFPEDLFGKKSEDIYDNFEKIEVEDFENEIKISELGGIEKKFEEENLQYYLKKYIGRKLSEKERTITKLYFGILGEEEHDFDEISEKVHLTKERVRQIKEKSRKKLKDSWNKSKLKNYLENYPEIDEESLIDYELTRTQPIGNFIPKEVFEKLLKAKLEELEREKEREFIEELRRKTEEMQKIREEYNFRKITGEEIQNNLIDYEEKIAKEIQKMKERYNFREITLEEIQNNLIDYKEKLKKMERKEQERTFYKEKQKAIQEIQDNINKENLQKELVEKLQKEKLISSAKQRYPHLTERMIEIYYNTIKEIKSERIQIGEALNVFYEHLNGKEFEKEKLSTRLEGKEKKLKFYEEHMTAIAEKYLEKFPEEERRQIGKDLSDRLLR